MKISCPDCQASFDADLPDLTEEGVEVKCTECQHSFLVMPKAIPVRSPDSPLPDSSEEDDHGPENQTQDEDNLDDLLDQLIDEENENNDEATADTDDSAGPELDNMLDDLISGDAAPSTEETAAPDEAGPELDNMLDDLISGDTETSTEEKPDETPSNLSDGEESELDTMADDATDDKTAPDSSETEEDITADSDDDDLDGLLDDILQVKVTLPPY